MTYIPDTLRQQVIDRAQDCCEYCLISQEDTLVLHEVDHIISEKHEGETTLDNLCLSCVYCNRHKGSDVGSIDRKTGQFVPLYNPRLDRWSDHFRLNGHIIEPLTAQGRVTVTVLQLNSPYQFSRRAGLIEVNSYPCQRD